MQRVICFAVLACLAGQALAGSRQIPTVNPPPPPPATSATVPGALFSLVVPGYTSLTWNSALSNTVCAGLKNRTSGYPTSNIECTVNAVTNTATAGISSIAVGGYLVWQAFPNMTTTQSDEAKNSRNLFMSSIKTTPTAIGINGVSTANLNDTCTSSFIPTAVNTASTSLSVAGWNPQAKCRIAPLGLTAENAGQLNFVTVTESTINTVGIDNGKVCPLGSPYINVASPVQVTTGLASTCSGATCTVTLTAPLVSDNIPIGQVLTTTSCGLVKVTGKPLSSTITIVPVGSSTFPTTSACALGLGNVEAAPWSGDCDSDYSYYSANSPVPSNPTPSPFGYSCPACAAGSSKSLFTYTGPNAGKYCTSVTGNNLIKGTPSTAAGAGLAGTSCIGPIGVADYGPGDVRTGKPMLDNGVDSGVAIANIFPTVTVLPYAVNQIAGVAIDTEFGVPCSTPIISQSTTTAITPIGMVGTAKLPTTGVIGYGTCNTQSRFWNGGDNTAPPTGNGIESDAYSSGILSADFTARIQAVPPPPAVPTPAPAPTPTPAPTPAPAPAPPTTCTYSGIYTIQSVACAGKFIAYNNDPKSNNACSNSTIMLRTDSQSKGNRKHWTINASAVSGTVPTAIGVIASGRTSKCTNDKYTNLAAANSSPTPRLAGSGWKNRIIPVDAAKGCDTVWIQAVGDNPDSGKYLGYGSCSSQTAFKWEAASSSSAIQWKLTKA